MVEPANGALIETAEASGFDIFVTTDKNLQYQQNLQGRRIAVLVLARCDAPYEPTVGFRFRVPRRKLKS